MQEMDELQNEINRENDRIKNELKDIAD